MKNRPFWLNLIQTAWKRRSIVWLSGVRRSGKTTLCKSLPGVDYYDCDLPSVRRALGDPEGFLLARQGKTVVFDEIHRLADPSEFLKIAADHFPNIRVLATGSSSLGAAAKFRDTLTGRKTEIWLTPMMSSDLSDIGPVDLDRRLWQGGLPPFFIDLKAGEAEFQEWMDSYWSRDILELFRLERRDSF
ncbi:MAG: AAA family ATPase [Elusimicrobia bacterium]|nr:AAA family ATPase [Elusimicrobiota bacterium]